MFVCSNSSSAIFFIDSPCISRQTAIRAYYTIARNDDGDFVMSNCTAYSLRRHIWNLFHFRYPDGNLTICNCFSIWNL